jgi:hypothetical protein
MSPTTAAPKDLRGHVEGSVYQIKLHKAAIYKFVSLADPGIDADNDYHDCGIAVFHANSRIYFRRVLSLLQSERWRYSVTYHRKRADDGVTETMVLRGPGKAGLGRVTIFALPSDWRSIPNALLGKDMQDAFGPYADFMVFQGYDPSQD